jgi:hypothetical protein
MTDSLVKLAAALNDNPTPTAGVPVGSQPNASLFGVVKSIQATSVTVTLGGSTTQVVGIKYLSSYRPVVNDTVSIVQAGSDLLILGSIGPVTLPACRAYLSVAQACVSGVATKVLIDTVDYDPFTMFNLANHRITVPVTGFYDIKATAFFNSVTSGGRIQSIVYKNGAQAFTAETNAPALGYYPGPCAADTLSLTAGDYLELWAIHLCTGNQNLLQGAIFTRISVALQSR